MVNSLRIAAHQFSISGWIQFRWLILFQRGKWRAQQVCQWYSSLSLNPGTRIVVKELSSANRRDIVMVNSIYLSFSALRLENGKEARLRPEDPRFLPGLNYGR